MYRRMAEDEWWDAWSERRDESEAEAARYAANSAELLEFDSDDEMEEYIDAVYAQKLEELLCS